MNLSPQAIKDFKQIYFAKRGVELTDEQANEMGCKLLELANMTIAKADEPP
jgi:hypothetical protein